MIELLIGGFCKEKVRNQKSMNQLLIMSLTFMCRTILEFLTTKLQEISENMRHQEQPIRMR